VARPLFLTGLLTLATLSCLHVRSDAYRAISSTNQMASAAVDNFGMVNDHLFRGAQPTEQGFTRLRSLGVDTVLSLTLVATGTEIERQQVERLGMRYVNVPMSATRPPTPEQVQSFFSTIEDRPGQTVFVHCWQGADRTGVMIALFRIAHDRWSADQALEEMRAYRFYPLFHPSLQRFVRAFAEEAHALE
jgi:tyrosine-protein phosphatase SIW14